MLFCWLDVSIAVGNRNRDYAILIAEHRDRGVLHIVERDLWKQRLVDLPLVHDTRNRLAIENVACELLCKLLRLRLVTFVVILLHHRQHRIPATSQFRLSVSVALDALDFR